jgi:hypothetical protein
MPSQPGTPIGTALNSPIDHRASHPEAPIRYRIEECRRTLIVDSTIPPGEWDPQALKDIFKLADIPAGEPLNATGHSQVYPGGSTICHSKSEIRIVEDNSSRSSPENTLSPPRGEFGSHSPQEMYPTFPKTVTGSGQTSSPIRRQGSPWTPSQTRPRILFYHSHNPHYGFTNFSPHAVEYKGKIYPTSEHLFQSFKVRHFCFAILTKKGLDICHVVRTQA